MRQFQNILSRKSRNILAFTLTFLVATVTLASCSNPTTNQNQSNSNTGIHKIKHIVVIMQENRSFDSYFGTYPGADGIPMQNGVPTVCINDPQTHQCVKPYHAKRSQWRWPTWSKQRDR